MTLFWYAIIRVSQIRFQTKNFNWINRTFFEQTLGKKSWINNTLYLALDDFCLESSLWCRVGARALTRCTFHSFSPLFSYDFTKSSKKSLFFEKWFGRIRKKRQKSPFLKYNKFRPRLRRVKRTQNVHKRNSPCRPCKNLSTFS